jgi:single-strand DNA-binding protein
MNIVTLTGRLTQDPELRYTPNDTAITTFGLAVNSRRGGNDRVDFFDIEAWRGLGVAAAKHIGKGRRVNVVGELRQQRWTDKDDNRRSKVVVVARNIEYLDRPDRDRASADAPDGDTEELADAFDGELPYEEPF